MEKERRRLGASAPRRFGAGVVQPALGLVLVSAACLKAQAFWNGASFIDDLFSKPALQLLALELEGILGLAMIAGVGSAMTRLAAIFLFCVLAIVAAFQWVAGDETCSCFGSWNLRPWCAFVFDVTAVALLVVSDANRDPRHGAVSSVLRRIGLLQMIECAVLVVLLLYGGLIARFGCAMSALAYLEGNRLLIMREPIKLGDRRPGESVTVELPLSNLEGTEVKIVGAKASCNCLVLGRALPMIIPSGEIRKLPITVRLGRMPGFFRQSITLYRDGAFMGVVQAHITANVEDVEDVVGRPQIPSKRGVSAGRRANEIEAPAENSNGGV